MSNPPRCHPGSFGFHLKAGASVSGMLVLQGASRDRGLSLVPLRECQPSGNFRDKAGDKQPSSSRETMEKQW